jgi:Transcription factor zinc-finger
MRFPSSMERSDIPVELKYCERCGGLWLRPQGGAGVYCSGCRACMAELSNRINTPNHKEVSTRTSRRRKARLQGSKVQARGDDPGPTRVEYLEGVAAMEVRL